MKYIQANTFCLDRTRLTSWMFGFLVAAIIFLLFRRLVLFLFTVFIEAFLLDLTAHFFSPQSLLDGVRLRLQNFPRIQWAIYVAGARGVRGLCLIGRRHDSVDRRFDEVW